MDDTFRPIDATEDERAAYLDALMTAAHERFGNEGFLVFGGVEVMLLWESLAASFVSGNWIAVVLSAQGMCERGLADMYSMQDLPGMHDHGRKGWEKAGLGTLLTWANEDGVLAPEMLAKIQVVCDRRKVLTHRRPPIEPGSILHRVGELTEATGLSFDEAQEQLLAGDACAAVDAVFSFCFGGQQKMMRLR